jgi:hypothetical protein
MTLNELSGVGVTQLRHRRTVVGKALQKVGRGVAKVGLAPIRNAYLVAMKFNYGGIAGKLKFGYVSPNIAQEHGYSLSKWKRLEGLLRRVENAFVKAGGKAESIKAAILNGRGNQAQNVSGLYGPPPTAGAGGSRRS